MIDDISVGGRNLILGTGVAKTAKGTGGTNQTTLLYNLVKSVQGLGFGGSSVCETYEFMIDTEPTGNASLKIQYGSTWYADFGHSSIPLTSDMVNKYTKVSRSRLIGALYSKDASVIKARLDGYTGTVTFRNVKLEFGTIPTDWSPAPEDLQPAGDYATKTELKATSDSITATVSKTYATREQLSQVEQTASGLTAKVESAESSVDTLQTLVRASGSGVEVAKKVNGAYTSTKTLMDDTGFSVLDKAGTVLSKFGSNLVQLGINSVSAIIEMCGGLLKISSRKDENGSTFARMETPSNGSGIELCCEGKAEDRGSVEVVSRVSRFVNRGGFNLSADYVNPDSSSPLNSVSVSGYADDNSSGASLSAKTITIDCSNLVVADLRNNVEMRGGQLVTEWAYLWRDGSDRFVRWCVRMGVCYLQAHRVNGVKSSGWKVGTLPASVRPDHSLWQPATPWHENNTAQMWVGGTEESDGGGPVWLYNNGSDDVFGIMSWPIG